MDNEMDNDPHATAKQSPGLHNVPNWGSDIRRLFNDSPPRSSVRGPRPRGSRPSKRQRESEKEQRGMGGENADGERGKGGESEKNGKDAEEKGEDKKGDTAKQREKRENKRVKEERDKVVAEMVRAGKRERRWEENREQGRRQRETEFVVFTLSSFSTLCFLFGLYRVLLALGRDVGLCEG